MTEAARLLEALRAKGWTLAVAESFTGGRLADAFVSVPGASDTFVGGVVAYANEAKLLHLGVGSDTLATVGAVSREVAQEMAQGVRAMMHADVGLSTTGIAGPSGARPDKPIGISWVGVQTPGAGSADDAVHPGDRDQVRDAGVAQALSALAKALDLPA